MRNLLRSRRGSAAFATVIALIPLIGVLGLGGEAGSWYVTRQAAQNAADAAAYSGALLLACQLGSDCTDIQTVAYRGKEFAAQNGFCNAGDTTYPGRTCATSLPANVSQSVTINQLTSWNGTTGNFVQAIVSQQQPAYLAAILGLTTVNIPAQAVARVLNPSQTNPPCALALTGSLAFQGASGLNFNAPGCTLASNDTANNALDFTGGGPNLCLNGPSSCTILSAAGGCSGSLCSAANIKTFQLPFTDPFSALDGALNTMCGASPGSDATCGLSTTGACKSGSTLVAYTAATPCTNNNVTTKGNTAVSLAAGVYFVSGTLTLKGGSSITGTGVTLILLPGASIDTKGGGTVTIAGPTTDPAASSFPPSLRADAGLFLGMAIYDASNVAVQFGGSSNINITGNIYAPDATVTFQGNPTLTFGGVNKCGEIIAASIKWAGSANFNDSGCAAAGVPVPKSQVVALVQ